MKNLVAVSLFVLFLNPLVASAGETQKSVRIGQKHLIILRSGVETVWGSYVFAVENYSDEAVEESVSFKLPEETVDFAPQEGAVAADLELGKNGGLILKKKFPPGMHMVSIGFEIPATGGTGVLTLKPDADVEDLTLLHPQSNPVTLESERIKSLGIDGNPKDPYQAYKVDGPVKTGQELKISLSGLPAGRQMFYYLGGIIMVFMSIFVVILAIKTKPAEIEGNDELLLAAK